MKARTAPAGCAPTNSATTLRSGGTLSGSGQLTIIGTGTVALGQNASNLTYGNGFTGNIVVSNSATLSLRNQNSMGSDALGVAGLAVVGEVLEQAEPDGWHRCSDRHPFAVQQIVKGGAVHVRTGHHEV